nr:hypothetical protein K-LCC10_0358 [Kaumoebavirus]
MSLSTHLLYLAKVPAITLLLSFGFPLAMIFYELGGLEFFLPLYTITLTTVALSQPPAPTPVPTPAPKVKKPQPLERKEVELFSSVNFIGMKRPDTTPKEDGPFSAANFVGLKRPGSDAKEVYEKLSLRYANNKIDDNRSQADLSALLAKQYNIGNRQLESFVTKQDINSLGEVSVEAQEHLADSALQHYYESAIQKEKVDTPVFSQPIYESVADYVREIPLGTPGFPLPDTIEPLEPSTDK